MHAADLFEPFKVLIDPPLHLTGKIIPGNTTESCLAKIRASLESTGEYRVIAIWRMGHQEGAWRDEAVKTVSTGKTWCLFADLLAREGYSGETLIGAANEENPSVDREPAL